MSSKKASTVSIENWCITKINIAETCYKWIIENFDQSLKTTSEFLESATFTASGCDTEWKLKLYPRGKSLHQKDFLSLSLSHSNLGKKHTINVEFSIVNSDGVVKHFLKHMRDDGSNEFFLPHFIKRGLVLKPSKQFLCTNGSLQIFCKLKISLGTSSMKHNSQESIVESDQMEYQFHVLDDLKELLTNQKMSDVILVAKDEKMFAQKFILAARSSYFSNLFHENPEKNLFEIDVDPKILRDLLQFIYLGKVEMIENTANDLLKAANKFSLESLRVFCEDHLMATLSVDNVIDLLLLAIDCNAQKLKTATLSLMKAHGNQIVHTPGFKSIKSLESHIRNEIFCTLSS